MLSMPTRTKDGLVVVGHLFPDRYWHRVTEITGIRARLAADGRPIPMPNTRGSPAWPSQPLSWGGTAGWSPASSTGRGIAAIRVGPESRPNLRRWSWKWLARTLAGDTIGSRERWPTWVTTLPIKRSAMFSDVHGG